MDEFERALPKLLIHEGGLSNHPKDPGALTMKGVTQRTYDAYRRRKGLPLRSVALISDVEVREIYREQYWNVIKGDQLPAGVSYVVFDGAVNSGAAQSIKWLQRALGVAADGVIGPTTLAAANRYPDNDLLIANIISRRLAFQKSLNTWTYFGKGWERRDKDVLAVGQAWASGSVGPEIAAIPLANCKALLIDAKSAPPKTLGDVSVGGGIVSATISQATQQLTPLTSIDMVAKVVTYLTLAGAVIAIGGFAYSSWAKRRKAALDDALDLSPAASASPESAAA